MELSSRLHEGGYAQDMNIVGIIKEVAPVKGAATDEELGVGEFQSNYFRNYPLYLDEEKLFYSFLGDKNLLGQKLHSWNPFTLYNDFKAMNNRLNQKGIAGNLKGEGLLKGGMLLITPEQGVVYRHEEQTGSEMPYDEIMAAVDSVRPHSKPTA